MTYKIKQIIIFLLIVLVLGSVIWSIIYNKNKKTIEPIIINDEIINEEQKEPISLCYYRAKETNIGLYDKSWIKLNILDKNISGEFQFLPAEKDSRRGPFEGIITEDLNPTIMGRKIIVWWDSYGEGMETREELAIEWGEGSATVGFGEMIDRGDGLYVYKDKSNLYYIDQMDQKDCDLLDEQLFVEKYIRDNIEIITTNKPVLGGTWYVVSIDINPSTKEGRVTYEDGHIQSKASFKYTFDKNTKNIVLTKFEVVK